MRYNSKHRGVGTLIAAVFILLILVTAYAAFTFAFSINQRYQEALELSNRLENERFSEKFKINKLTPTQSGLEIEVENYGEQPVTIDYVCVFNDSFRNLTDIEDAFVKPHQKTTITVNLSITKGTEVQVVSTRGNFASLVYIPPAPPTPVPRYDVLVFPEGTAYTTQMLDAFIKAEINGSYLAWVQDFEYPLDTQNYTWSIFGQASRQTSHVYTGSYSLEMQAPHGTEEEILHVSAENRDAARRKKGRYTNTYSLDGKYYQLEEVGGANERVYRHRFNFTTATPVESMVSLSVNMYAGTSRDSEPFHVQIFDFSAGDFVNLTVFSGSLSWVNHTITSGIQNYVRNGVITVRVIDDGADDTKTTISYDYIEVKIVKRKMLSYASYVFGASGGNPGFTNLTGNTLINGFLYVENLTSSEASVSIHVAAKNSSGSFELIFYWNEGGLNPTPLTSYTPIFIRLGSIPSGGQTFSLKWTDYVGSQSSVESVYLAAEAPDGQVVVYWDSIHAVGYFQDIVDVCNYDSKSYNVSLALSDKSNTSKIYNATAYLDNVPSFIRVFNGGVQTNMTSLVSLAPGSTLPVNLYVSVKELNAVTKLYYVYEIYEGTSLVREIYVLIEIDTSST